jgi:DNA-binding response OmpR family regulator
MTATGDVVLIGEPDPATNRLYQRTLGAAFTVIAVSDEDAMLSLLRTTPIIALVLEPTICTASGWAGLATISGMCAAQGIPLIVCSTLDERKRGLALGAAAYLVKPTLPATLLATLRQVIGSGAP